MKLPLWYKSRSGKYFTLTYYEDGKIGIPAVEFATRLVFSDNHLDPGTWEYEVTQDRYLLKEDTT